MTDNQAQSTRSERLARLALVIVPLLCFGRAVSFPFALSWDDARFIVDNPDVREPGWDALVRMFSSVQFEAYHPLHLLSYWLDVPWAAGEDLQLTATVVHALSLLPPVDQQEIWAAGVTYTRSRKARMEESDGAASFYDKVYEAPRPELFFKANAYRAVGPDRPVRIRQDALWNVPEPELTLVLNSQMRLVGYTIGNDMSSRDIEGENPLYLPQAKVYDQSCALGPCIALINAMPPRSLAANREPTK